MANIAKRAEGSIDYHNLLNTKSIEREISVTDAISHATCTTAADLDASAILTATSSGYTTRMVSKFRPSAPIIAATTKESVRRRLSLIWGVHSILTEQLQSTDDIINIS